MTGHEPEDHPELVSVLVPVLNEIESIDRCLSLVLTQTHGRLDVIVADGGSVDGTRERVEALMRRDDRLRFVDNPARIQAAGLNRALALAKGSFCLRVDARSFLPPDYVERCVAAHRRLRATAFGGRMVPEVGRGATADAIGLANAAWWGAGPAGFHRAGAEREVETVYLGSYVTAAIRDCGGWDPSLAVNEDYELNHRIREAGGSVWIDPTLEVGYWPRSTFGALARQYWRYGESKPRVIAAHPSSTRVRQLIPAALLPLGAVALTTGSAGRVARRALTARAALLSVLAGTIPGVAVAIRVRAFVAAEIMHWTWSIGFWRGLLDQLSSEARGPDEVGSAES